MPLDLIVISQSILKPFVTVCLVLLCFDLTLFSGFSEHVIFLLSLLVNEGVLVPPRGHGETPHQAQHWLEPEAAVRKGARTYKSVYVESLV